MSKSEEEIKAKAKKGFLAEFREFAIRGNVMDMAVGVIIGAAFTGIINSLVKDILMPVIGLISDNYNFSALAIKFSENNSLTYGMFIQAIINFVLIALVLFIIIKFFNKLRREKKDEAPLVQTELGVLTEIRDILKEK